MDAIIALEDGTVLHGKNATSLEQTVCGELVFNTAMTGYQEVITDPSYSNQIVVFTYPHIGNTGINISDNESDRAHLSGIIARDIYNRPTHWESRLTLPDYLRENKVPALCEIDTRYLTKRIRSSGAINACIMTGKIDIEEAILMAKNFKGVDGVDLAKQVTTKTSYTLDAFEKESLKLAVIDYGVKSSILNFLRANGCSLSIYSAKTSLSELDLSSIDGIMLSNGPGDPKAVDYGIEFAKSAVESGAPVMGICLGAQILALSLGAKTKKMKFGHHGINHPVKSIKSGKVLITSQNHGFVIEIPSHESDLVPTHTSLFDHTLQGFSHITKPIFGFQGHPESGPGPEDGREIFKPFLDAAYDYRKNKTFAFQTKGDLTYA